jgi:putative FmdB family regulatory protein
MPTYEYRCRDCGYDFEALQSFSDDALTECPQCAGSLRKIFGNIGVTFKGSGFYKNDHGGRAKTKSASGESSSSSSESASSSSDSSSSSSSSSDSSAKPATPAPAAAKSSD